MFKPKILCAINRIKEKKKHPDIDSIYHYLSRTEASKIDKISIELILNEMVKENVVVNKKTSLGDSFRWINTPSNLVNSLHTDSCPIMNKQLQSQLIELNQLLITIPHQPMVTFKLLLLQMTIFPALQNIVMKLLWTWKQNFLH